MNRLLAGASRLLLTVLALLLGWLTPVHASGPSRSVAGDPVATAPAAEIAPVVQVFLVAYRGQGPPEVLGVVSARLMPSAGIAAQPARAFYFVVVDFWPLEGVRNRAYDPTTGRWLSRDPDGENGGLNLYGYCYNNPINDIDPLGLGILGDYLNRQAEAIRANGGCTKSTDWVGESFAQFGQDVAVFAAWQAVGMVVPFASNRHHAFPKFLGGNPGQLLTKLPTGLHKQFHNELARDLKLGGFPMNVGGKGGGAADWNRYFLAFKGSQKDAVGTLLQTTIRFDTRNGTSIANDLILHIIDGKFTRVGW